MDEIKVVKTKNKNHVDVSSSLSKLAEVESNNNKMNHKFTGNFLVRKLP